MKKRDQKIQIALIFVGLILIVLTYFYYPNLNKNLLSENENIQIDTEKNLEEEESTFFENVQYEGVYDFDKKFKIQAEEATILNKESDIVHIDGMYVVLYLNDGRVVNIEATRGRYNKATYDIFFQSNVKATDGETLIFAENMDLLATKDSAIIYNEVYLTDARGDLRADRVTYDFETQFYKISMNSMNKRVKVNLIQ